MPFSYWDRVLYSCGSRYEPQLRDRCWRLSRFISSHSVVVDKEQVQTQPKLLKSTSASVWQYLSRVKNNSMNIIITFCPIWCPLSVPRSTQLNLDRECNMRLVSRFTLKVVLLSTRSASNDTPQCRKRIFVFFPSFVWLNGESVDRLDWWPPPVVHLNGSDRRLKEVEHAAS